MKQFLRNLALVALLCVPWVTQGQQAIPYSYGFEDNNLSTDGWILSGSTSPSTKIYSESDAPEGSYLFKFHYSEQGAHLISPLLTGTENGVNVTFKYMRSSNSSSYAEKFKVGYTTDENVTDPTEFTYGDEIVTTTSWEEYESTFPAGTKRIAIKYIYIDGYYLRLDDFNFFAPPSCSKPTDVTVSNITANGARISWSSINDATATYTITDGNAINVTTNPGVSYYDFTTLTANTAYGPFTLTANCGESDHSEAAAVSGFTTACNPIATADLPYEEGFEDYTGVTYSATGVVPDCWSAYSTGSVKPHVIGSGSYYYKHSGTKALTFYGSGYCYATLPPFEAALNTLQISFWYQQESASSGTLTLGYITDEDVNMSTFTPIVSYDGVAAMTQAPTTYLNEVPATATRLVFRWYYSSQYSCCIDDIEVKEMSSCMPVTNLTAAPENITPNSITLTWTDNNNGATYIITDGEDNAIPAAQIENLTTTGVTITGLTANTAYSFKVKADCGGGEYSDAVSINNVKTACGAEAIPFTMNFEDGASNVYVPSCWKAVPNPTGSYSYAMGRYSSSTYAHSGSYSLRSYYATNNKIILPEMDAATNTLQVRFWHRQSYSGNYGSLQVGYLTDIEDTSTFVAVQSFNNIGNTYIESEVSLENAPADARIAFRHIGSSSSNYTWYIDDITVETIPACKNVTAVTNATNITSTGATLSWTDTRNEGATYTIYNKATEPTTILGTTTEAGVTTINLTGLTANTTYNQLVVVANCSDNEHSGEVSVPSFRTKNDECAITAVSVTAPAGVTRGDVVINDENHSVTIPVYYLTDAEIAALAGNITKSTGATIYAYNATTSDWTTQVYTLAGIRDSLAMNTPYTVRVVAEDPAVYQDWTITLQGEECSTPRNLTFAAERTSLTANWANADPTAVNYQVVISPSALDEEGLDAAVKTAVDGATTYTFTGLLRETEYHIYVRTNCGNDTYSSWLNDSVTTKGLTFCEDVTVADGPSLTANDRILLRSSYQDEDYRSQVIYPASKLSEIEGKTITSITFYLTGSSAGYSGDWAGDNGNTFTLKLANTTQENLSSGWDETATTTVYNGTIDEVNSGNGNTMVFDLTTPFTYTGGNLLVELLSETVGYYSSVSFNGVSSTDAARYAEGDSYLSGAGTVQNFLPKFTATYCETNEACPAVAEIEVSDITETGATVEWTASAGDYVSGYQVINSETELDAAALDAYAGPYAYEGTALTCDLTGLTAYTNYYIYVRANCGAPDNVNSTWQSATFRTLSACGAVADLAVEQTGKTTVVATWTKTKEAQASNFNYILSTDEYDVETQGDVLNGMPKAGSGITDLTVTLNVDPATHYYLYVQNYCEGEGASPWKSVDFTTYDAMPAVVGLTATEITHTAIAATWQKNVAQFADETQWQVAAVLHGETPAAWTVVNDTHYTFVGLTPETSYDLHVRPYQASPEAFGAAALHEATTTATPGDCITIGTGTTANSSFPFGCWYNHSYTQQLYTAEDLNNKTGNIESIKFNYTLSTVTARSITVYMGTTDATSLSNGWATPDNMTEVFHTAAVSFSNADANWYTLNLDEPFNYEGGNLVVAVLMDNDQSADQGYSSTARFNVSSANNMSRYFQDDSHVPSITDGVITGNAGTVQSVRNNIQFCFEAEACPSVSRITVSDITTNSANVSWMPGNTEVMWAYKLLDAELSEPTGVDYQLAETPYVSYDALLTDHDYRFWVRPVMNNELCGSWQSVTFQTVASCGMPTVLPADGITATTATLHAQAHETIGTAQNYTFRYWKNGDEDNKITVNPSVENSANITNLTPNTTYWYDVMVSCGENDDSRWSLPLSFVTDYQNFTLPYSTDFAAGRDNEWRMVNGTHANEWHIGTAASNTANGRGLYISNDGGTTNAYNNSGACVVFAYAAFSNFEASKQYTVNFDWKNKGETGNYDFIRAWIVPDNAEFAAGTSYPSGMSAATGNPTGWISLDGGTPLKNVTEWQHKKAYVTVPADGAYKIVFMWRQDNSGGDNPAAAIDNVSIVESEKYDITVNVTKIIEDVAMGADPTAKVGDEPLASLTDIYENTTVTLTAGDPIYGYEFVNWTDNNGNTKGSGKFVYLTLMSDTVLNANYDSASFTITAVADAERGTAFGTATVKFNLPVMLTAKANTGYHFVNWTSMVDGVPVEAAEPTVEDTIIVNAYRDSTFTAHFDTNEYHVTVFVEGQEMGTVAGPEFVKHFTSADYVPTAYYGYHFVNWTDVFDNVLPVKEGTENTLNIAAVSDTTVYANFDYDRFTVTAETDNMTMGSVAGSNEVNYLETVTLTATPEVGFHFVNWTRNGAVVSTNATMDVVADSNYTFIAHFDTNVYHVNVIVNNTMGSVSGPVTVKHFLSGNYEATANPGYHFVNWTDSVGNTLGADALLTLYPESDTSIYANFAVNTYALTVNVAAECEGWGSVSGSNAAAEHFQNYQISATPEVGYHFVQWQDGNDDNPRTVTLTEAKTYTATFDTNVYELNVVSANTVMGSVSGSVAEAKHFLNYEISATANYGYHFTGWNDNNKDNPRTVTLTESKTYTANFDYNQYTVNGVSSNNDWGSVSGSATVNYLTPVTLTATPEYGYVFVSWKEADTVYSTNDTIDVEANAARTLTAVFAKDQFTVTASVAAGCEAMGTVAPGSTTAEYMTPVTLTATPEEGYHLVSWSNGATTNQITVYADSARALVATFAINVYDITISYDAQRGTVTNDDDNDASVANGYVFKNVEHGTVLHLTATVDEGSRFAGWNDGSATVTTESIAYTATATRTLTANFIDAGNYQVTLNYSNVMGTVTGAGAHHADNDVTITATANYGYHFVAWVNESGDSIYTDTYTFTMPQSEVEYTAVFDYNQYTLTVASADTVMGTVTNGATVNYLSTVPVNATNKYGYHFTHWYGSDINDTVATTASATIQVLRDSTVTANFDYNQYAISAVSADETKGSVSGSATANYLSHVILTATPAAGYHFVKWTNAAGAEVGTAAELDVEVREAATFTAHFEETLAELAWSAESFTGYSSIDFNAWAPTLQNPHNVEVRYGAVEEDLTIDAETGVIGVEMENGHAVMLTGTYHIYAVHETSQDYYYDSVSYTLTVENGVITVLTQNIDEGGVVSFPDYTQEASLYYHYFADENSTMATFATFAHGTDMRAEATPATGFEFVEWQVGDNFNGYEFLSTDNPVTYTLPDALTAGLKAIFDTVEYDVTVMVNEVEGSVEGPATVKHFLSGTYTATATPCYHFLNWTNAEGTVVLGTEPTLTIAAVSDSTIKANFELNVYTGDTTVDVCDEFEWHDVTYTTTPEEAPTFVYSTVNGCDSTVTLHLTIRHSQTVVLEDPIIACDSVEWNGTWYYESGEQSFTTDGANGCDSTTTVMLTINHSNTGDTTAVACNSFDWYEYTEITASTEELTHVFTNAAGCDSVVTLHLTVNYSNTGDTTATACDSFDWYGESYDESGDYTTTLTNVAGCDSVVTLHLTINYSNTGDTTATACNSFDWYGESYDESGDYTTTLTNAAGCDSVVTLHLTVNYSNTGDTAAVACDSFEWYGETYTSTPDVAPTYTFTNVAGCDSVVTLHLTINHSQTVTLDPVSAYDSYEWNGETYTESGQLSYSTVGANGCDSTTTVMLTINHYDSITVVLTINDATMGTTDPVAGTYRFYPGDAVSATATANTGYSFVGWAVTAGSLSDTLPNAQLSYEFVPEMAGMTLYVEAVFVQAVGIENVDYSNLNIYGADNKVYVKGAEGMTIYIYDVNGRCMARRANASDSETFTLNMTGVILVKAGNAPAKRVVLVR